MSILRPWKGYSVSLLTYLPASLRLSSDNSGTGILTCFPFAITFLLMLRSRLPQGGQTFPWKPWTSGRRDSRRLLATHSCILTSDASRKPYGAPSSAYRTLSYQAWTRLRSFGLCLSPVTSSAQALSTSELLRTLSRYGCF